MAKKEKPKGTSASGIEDINPDAEDFSGELIKAINKELGVRVAYNLSTDDDAPTIVKRWISTGSRQLDYNISNRRHGGVPEGRVIEIFGPPSIGKSHLAYHMAANTQQLGGLVVYIDTENATPVDKLAEMGINVAKRFVYVDEHCTENVFTIMESTIVKAKAISALKDIPILVIWDSVAATSPKQELEGEYDASTIGLNARVIGKGMRKIVGVIGQNNVTLLCLNQTRTKVGFVMGDPTVVPGGAAIPFHASIRIDLRGGSHIKENGIVKGIQVHSTIKKNKIARPYRKATFNIIFGRGIVEHVEILDVLRRRCEAKDLPPVTFGEFTYSITGNGGHKDLLITDKDGVVIHEKKVTKTQFGELFNDPVFGSHMENFMEAVYTSNTIDMSGGSDEGGTDENE